MTFAPRTTEQTIRLATVDDDIDETGERVEVTLAAGADYTLGAPLAATGRILDDEGTSEVTVVAAADAVTEGEAAVFTLTRVEGDVSQALAVPVAIEDAAGVLLPGAPSSVTFAAGDATATLRLGTDDDTLDEPDAAVTLTLAAGAGYDLGTPSAATVTVRDDDAPPSVSIADADAVPEGGALEFVVSLSHPSTATVAVDYRLGGTAVAGSDYRGDAAGAVTFTPGVTAQRIRLVTVGNDLDGADRTVTVTLAAPDPGLATLGDPSSAAGRIEDDDLPLVTIAPDAFAVREGRDAVFTLTRANTDLSAALEVAVAVTDAGGVLTDAAPTSVSFAAGEAAATLSLGTDDDDIAEPDAVTVTVTLAAGGTYDLGTPAKATVTVRDTEARPVVSIAHTSVTEGGTLRFAVSLNRASTAEIAVGYTVTHGNSDIDATAGADYLGPASGTVTFAPGDRRKLISIETVDDDADEPTERFHVTLLPPDSRLARLSSNPILRVASGQIRDNDLQTVTVEAVSDAVGEWNVLDHLGDHEVRDKRMFLVTRTRGDEVSKPLTVTFTIGDEDGVLATSPLPTGETFAAHDFERLVFLATDDDDVDEDDATVTLTLADGAGYRRGASSEAAVTVWDDDGNRPTVFMHDAPPVTEGGTLQFPVRLSHPHLGGIRLVFTVADSSTATVDEDYRGVEGRTVIFPYRLVGEQETARTLRIETLDDRIDEPEETVVARIVEIALLPRDGGPATDTENLLDASHPHGPIEATGRILDDDEPVLPVVTVAPIGDTVEEDGGAGFNLTRASEDLSEALEVFFTVEDPDGVLTSAAPTGATIEAGSLTALVAMDAEVDGADAALTLTLADGAGYRLGDPHTATQTVQDDDPKPVVTTGLTSRVTEGGTLTFEVELALAIPARAIPVSYRLGGTAVPGEDYRGAASGAVTIAPGRTKTVLSIRTVDDDIDEPQETVVLTLLAPDPALAVLGSPSTSRAFIQDNDPSVVTVAAAPAAVAEGEDAVFTLTRAVGISDPLEVAVAVTDTDGVLTAMPLPTSVAFAADAATATLRLGTEDDAVAEAGAAVVLTLQPGAGYTLGAPAQATVTVADDDGVRAVSIGDAGSVTEGDMLAFPVRLSDAFGAPITVGYTLGGTAAAGADHDGAAAGAVTFAPGEVRKTVSLATVDDSADEPVETVEVEIFVFHPARAGASTEATGRILDDDLPDVTVAAEAAAVTEGADAVFVLTRAGVVSEALEVAVEVTDADGVLTSTPLPASVTFGAGEATATLRLGTRDNAIDDPADATVTLTLQAGAAWDLEAPSAATVTVQDDERPVVTVAAEAAAVGEGEDVAFTLARTGDVSEALDVFFTIEDADGVVTSTPLPTGVTFGAGNAAATLRLGTEPDTVVEPDAVVTLMLGPGAGYEPGDPSRASVTVREDDGGASRASVVVGDPDAVVEGGTLEFAVRLSNAGAEEIRVSYRVSGTARPGTDHESVFTFATESFAPGETERTVRIVTLDDDEAEPEETVRVEITTVSGPAVVGLPAAATGRILDDERPVVTVAADAAAVTEGAEAAFTLTRAGDVSEALVVPVEVTDAGGVLASPAPASVTIAADAATAQVTLATVDDDADAAAAAVVLTLMPGGPVPAWALGDPATATVTVEDDDLPVVTVAAESERVVEGEALAFIVTRAGDRSAALTVTAVVTAPGDADRTETATFAVGDATARIDGGSAPEVAADRVHTLTLQAGAGYRLGAPSAATVTVRDDDAIPDVSIAAADAVREGGTLAFPVSLSGPFNAPIAVAYTLGGTATAGVDYTDGGAGAVTFAAGDTERTISLATVDDADDETAETVRVTLADGATWNLGVAQAEGRLLDNDGLPEVTVAADADAAVEGEAAAFTLTRWGDVSATLEVFVAVTDAGAVLTGAAPTSVTFAADAATATLRLATDDDTVDEADAPLTLTLQSNAAYELGTPSEATVTVEDDDAAPAASIADAAAVTEGGTLEFPVTLSHPSAAAIPVAYRLGGTATAGDDYTDSGSGTVTFAPGEVRKVIALATTDDGVDEAEETVEVELFVFPPGRPGEPGTASARIRDDDLPVVTVAADAATVTEGADAAFTLTRTGDASAALAVTVAVTGGDAVLDGAPPTEVTFAADAATARVALATDDDRTDEPDARVVLTLAAGGAWALGTASQAAVTVQDDDGLPEASIADPEPVAEGAALQFPVTLSHPSAAAITVAYTLAGSATAGGDYTDGGAGAVTFAPGDVRRVVSLATVDDGADEAEETVAVTLTAPDPALATLGTPATASGRIRDGERPVVTVAAEAGTVTEGADAVFVLTRAAVVTGALAVTVEVTGGGTVLAGAPPTEAAFAADATTVRVPLATTNDITDEPDTTLTLTLAAGDAWDLGASSEATVTVEDDDAPPAVSIADAIADAAATVAEGGTLAFPVRLSHPSAVAITVAYTLAGTATAGDDYTDAGSGSVTFAAGSTEATIALATVDDDADEPEETVEVTLTAPDPAVLGAPSTASGAIADDDLPVVTVAAAPDTVAEGEDAVFVLTRAGVVSEALAVTFTVADADRILVSNAPAGVTFAAGVATARVTLATRDDDVAGEADDLVTLTLADGATWDLGAASEATVTVRDDDLPVVTVVAEADAVTEGRDTVFTLTRTGDVSAALDVSIVVTEPGADEFRILALVVPPTGVRFGAGEAEVTLRLPTRDDLVDRPDGAGAVTVTVQADAAAWELGDPFAATVAVEDNDLPLVRLLTVGDPDLYTEGEDVLFRLTRTEGDLSGELRVGLSYRDRDDALAPGEPSSVTFGVGEAEVTLRLPTNDDSDPGDKRVTVSLPLITQGYIWAGDRSRTVTVRDNDGDPLVTVAAGADVIAQGEAAAFTLTRTGNVSGALAVSFAVADGDGVLASPAPSGVSFAAGVRTAALRLATQEDALDRSDATLTLTLQSGTGYRLETPPGAATVTVSAVPIVTVAVVRKTIPEGANAAFTLTRTGDLSGALAVNVTIGRSIEVRVSTPPPSSVSFGADEATLRVEVPTRDDDVAGEDDGSVSLNLRPGAGYRLLGALPRVTVTVRDDDVVPEVSVAAAGSVTEGGTLAFPVTLSRPFNAPIPVDWTLGGTATAGDDHDGSASGTVTFAPGEVRKELSFATVDDDVDEAEETVEVTLTAPDPALATLGTATATGRILDDDLPVVTVGAASDTVTEGAAAVFILTRAGVPSERLTVTFAVTGGGAVLAGAPPTEATFEANRTALRVTLATDDDGTDEADAALTLTLQPGAGRYRPGDPSQAMVTVRDDDAEPTLSIADAAAVTEGGTLAFPVTLSGPYFAEIMVDYTLGGTATVGDDYTDSGAGALTFAPREVRKVISLATVDDSADEAEERVEVTLSLPDPPYPAMLKRAIAAGRILDGDGISAVTVAAVTDTVVEGADAVFTLTRADGDLSQALTVSVAVTDAGAVLAGTAPAGVTFDANEATATLRLATDDDTLAEADATLTLTLSAGAAYGLGTPSAATVTVRDDDGTPTVSIADAGAVTEGGTLAFPVTLSGPFNARIAVPYTLGGAATAGDDYTDGGAGSVTFAPGEVRTVISLATVDDRADEPDETVAVTLAAGASWELDPSPEATGTITDDDPPVVTVAADADAVAEGADAVFTLTRAGVVSATLTVTVAVTDAGAVLAAAAPDRVTFMAGEATATLRLGTQDDTDAGESDAALTLALPQPAGDAAYAPGEPSEVTVTVRDDDAMPEVSVAAAGSVTEGGALAFPVTLNRPFNAPIAVDYTLGGAATAGADYAGPASGTVTFAAKSTRETITLQTLADKVDEPDETVAVTLSPPDPAQATLGTPSTAEGTIIDGDLPVVTVAADETAVTEGEDAVFTLTREGVVSDELEVAYAFRIARDSALRSLRDGVVGRAGDGQNAATVTFEAGQSTVQVRRADAGRRHRRRRSHLRAVAGVGRRRPAGGSVPGHDDGAGR